MMLTRDIAQKLDMPVDALERASLRAYLEARRREIDAQLFLLVKKHGVQTVQEFDAAVRAGRIERPTVSLTSLRLIDSRPNAIR